MIDDAIPHDAELLAHLPDVFPVAERRMYALIVRDGEAVVGGPGVERQDVDCREGSLQTVAQKRRQRFQWRPMR